MRGKMKQRKLKNLKKQLKFFKKLADYFKNVPKEDIDQSKGSIEKGENCGCFGAHIAKMEDRESSDSKGKYFHFKDGIKIFREQNMGEYTQHLLIKNGANFEIFGTKDWSYHPYQVITRVIAVYEKYFKTH